MAQEGTWEGASRAGPLSELIRLRPVQWDPELCVKAEPPPLALGAAEVTSAGWGCGGKLQPGGRGQPGK